MGETALGAKKVVSPHTRNMHTLCAFPPTGLEGQHAGTVESTLAGPHRTCSEGKSREHEALEKRGYSVCGSVPGDPRASVIVISFLVSNLRTSPACLLAFWMEQTKASMIHIFHE